MVIRQITQNCLYSVTNLIITIDARIYTCYYKGDDILKTNELLKLLKKNKMKLYRHGANHDIWYSPITEKYFVVGRHNKEIPTGTLRNILKDAGIHLSF